MRQTGEPYYEVIGSEVDVFKICHAKRLPLMTKGPTGCGKSRFIEYMAHQLGRNIITVSCNEDTTAIDLLGRYTIKDGDTIWQDGPLTRAVREGAILYLDEIVEAREDVIVAIHSLTDHRRELFLDAQNEAIKAKDEFMLVISMNPGYQKSFKELKMSTRQRFVALDFDYPNSELETKIVAKESAVDTKVAAKLVKIANKVRPMNELGVNATVSTRLLVNAAKLIESGLSPRLACSVSISRCLSDDSEIIQAIDDLIALHL